MLIVQSPRGHGRLFVNSRYSPDCGVEPPGEECWFPPCVHMLSLELCERPATQSSPAVENAPAVEQGPSADATPADGNAPNAAGSLAGKRQSWRFSTRRLISLA